MIPPSAGHATSIYVKARAGVNSDNLGKKLVGLQDGLKYQTSEVMAAGINEQVSAFNIVLEIMKGFSLIVAAITVFIVTYVELMNKRKQVGIQRAIGIKPVAIVLVYIIKSLIFSVVGIALGAVIFSAVAVPWVQARPFNFPYGPVALFVKNGEMQYDAIILVIVALASALVPAIRSVRIKILDAIWGVN